MFTQADPQQEKVNTRGRILSKCNLASLSFIYPSIQESAVKNLDGHSKRHRCHQRPTPWPCTTVFIRLVTAEHSTTAFQKTKKVFQANRQTAHLSAEQGWRQRLEGLSLAVPGRSSEFYRASPPASRPPLPRKAVKEDVPPLGPKCLSLQPWVNPEKY